MLFRWGRGRGGLRSVSVCAAGIPLPQCLRFGSGVSGGAAAGRKFPAGVRDREKRERIAAGGERGEGVQRFVGRCTMLLPVDGGCCGIPSRGKSGAASSSLNLFRSCVLSCHLLPRGRVKYP